MPATPVDAELLYLTKQAEMSKVHRLKSYKNMLSKLDRESASAEERVEAMRRYWNRRLKVKDVTKLPEYNPMGVYQPAFRADGKTAGYRHHYRFDISSETLDKEMEGYGLYHSLTAHDDMADFLDLVLDSNGAMVCTNEKMRIGVPVSGASPLEDMKSGGANYFFTRIQKLPSHYDRPDVGLYFKKDMLRRLDSISYDNDYYGRTNDYYEDFVEDFVGKNRKSTIPELLEASKNSGNETNFRNSVMILDNLDSIVVGSRAQRDKVLAVFRRRKIDRLPDGKPIKDVVVLKNQLR